MEGRIQVVIASEPRLLREGVTFLLQQEADLEEVGEATSGKEILEIVKQTRPDVLLLDPCMPEADQSDFLPQIYERSPSTKVLLLVDSCTKERVLHMLREGARGCILKSVSSAELFQAIRAVHAGEAWVEKCVLGDLWSDLVRPVQESRPRQRDLSDQLLSRREMEIARLVAAGCSNKAIAAQLSISEKTVKSHLVNIFHKLKISHRLQLAVQWLETHEHLNGRLLAFWLCAWVLF